ncbi:hypothetical protein ACJ5H2_04965 [Nocardioides sp. R1-1]|uniref:hypothetical protein n=1 Tax=Nocardioides sp. R1-1 TaxID=3383502 RepID=UPI0038D0D9AA
MDLSRLNERWAEWAVHSWAAGQLVLIADNDLTYHHEVEVRFDEVEFAVIGDHFNWPVFRPVLPEEEASARPYLDAPEHARMWAWDAEVGSAQSSMLVAARSATVIEERVLHDR